MKRKIVKINEEACTGCGLCAEACHEGAIGMVNGKAKLLRDDYCDGLGDCLPACPAGAISVEEREAEPYDEAAVKAHIERRKAAALPPEESPSQLAQWPCQIKLMPVSAPYYQGAQLLVAADCTAYACADFHRRFMQGHITVIGCPKLDGVDYSEKLTQIIAQNDIRGVTLLRMEVPCCGGLENAAKKALQQSGKFLPLQVVTLSVKGEVLST